MSSPAEGTGQGTNEGSSGAREILLAAAISILTVVTLVGAIEGASWLWFRESKTSTLSCLVLNDASTGVRALPGSECRQSTAESPLVDYRFNRCGHRTDMDCGPKRPGVSRIVLIGSSFAYGLNVDQADSFAALLPEYLSRRTGAQIDLYNEAMQWGFPSSVILRLDAVTAVQPDVILWPITPTDINYADLIIPSWMTNSDAGDKHRSAWQRLLNSWRTIGPEGIVRNAARRTDDYLEDTRFMFLFKHFLYLSRSQYIRQYLARTDPDADYLKTEPSATLQSHLQRFSECLATLERQAKAIGATVVVTTIPDRAQAAMISMHEWPAHADPYRLDNAIKSIATSQGITYLEVPEHFKDLRNPEKHYMPVDGHPDADGHALIADLLARTMLEMHVLPQPVESKD